MNEIILNAQNETAELELRITNRIPTVKVISELSRNILNAEFFDDDVPKFVPWVLIPAFTGDTGNRPSTPMVDLGPDSPSIWFEEYVESGVEGQIVQNPELGGNYQIAVRVENLGSAPSFGICIDFFAWVRTQEQGNKIIHLYDFVSYAPQVTVFEKSFEIIRSRRWSPGGPGGLFPGDIIVRAYDPLFDPFNQTEPMFYVQNDRHLAHRSFK